ncbi:MAG: ABC transporter ATP-binding protein [Alphaproteobacteria bacterium]
MLEVTGLTCGYGDITAVDGLSFTVGPGEIFGLIGANGAGKTTTIMALAGLIPVRSGTVRLAGRDITNVPAHTRADHGIALVPEGRRVFADLTVDENLTVGGARLDRRALEQNRTRVFETFPRLAERRRQLAGSLSGGEQQMLAIGRAVMAAPSLLLVDELSLGLMPIAVDECYRVLGGLQDDGLAILLVEQSTERVLLAARRIAVLESGRLAWTGTGEEAALDSAIVAAYLGLGEG